MSAVRHARVLSEIVRLIIPAQPELDPAVNERVRADVTVFVARQIQAMPAFLRLPYELALVGFNLLPLLWRGRPFVALAANAQEIYLAAWSDGSIGALRDVVKLIRSCALLAYFDHPEISGGLEARRPQVGAPVVYVEYAQIGMQ